MVRQPTQVVNEKDEKVFDLESQKVKDTPNMLKYASKVLTDTLSPSKDKGARGSDDNEKNEKEQTNYGSECLICFEKINVGDDIRVIPCLHRFHKECLDQWLLERTGSCPNCRLDLHIQQAQEPQQEAPIIAPIPAAAVPNQRITDQMSPGLNFNFNSSQPSTPPSSGWSRWLFNDNNSSNSSSFFSFSPAYGRRNHGYSHRNRALDHHSHAMHSINNNMNFNNFNNRF
ncbi:RING finger protein 165 [Smittium mucronatum]|uniref:RING-type E3 ubiquitin transferase n=1 Tax=Smittium mucronatum TaxID=133383 RepID=A0A1R0H846_9FUNG|nr:RING finger protein 165 [Smittium mucronatum]